MHGYCVKVDHSEMEIFVFLLMGLLSCWLSVPFRFQMEIKNSRMLPFDGPDIMMLFDIQSTLVISTSVISNNRISRRENDLIPVLTQKSNIR